MKVYTRVILLVLVLLATTLHADKAGKKDNKLKFLGKLHILHNLDTTKEIAQPAFFQAIFPDKGEDTIGIGIGLKYDVLYNDSMELGFFAEYKRNTQIDKEQDVLKTGVAMEWQPLDLSELSHSPILIAKINYKRDGIQDTGSLQAVLAYTHVFTGRGNRLGFPLPNTTLTIPRLLQFTYSPYLGLEYENVNSPGADGLKGDTLRGYFQLEAALYPLGKELRQRLELTLSYIYRRDITNSISEKNMSYKLLKTGISYYFIKEEKHSAGIGITYVNGEDPSVGLEKQKYLQISLKLKVN